uniref:fibrinogen-binding protein n=1 Tax=Staphylococcus aureus TaxID=1280 RepID=UPI0023B1B333
MKKNITKVIIASTVIATSLLTQSNDAKAFFSYEWKGLEIAKKEADQAKKDEERADKLIKEADEKVMDAQKAVNLFKRTRTVATHRKAQRAVNLIHFQHS